MTSTSRSTRDKPSEGRGGQAAGWRGRQREVLDAQPVAAAQQHRALARVLQLAHVARPRTPAKLGQNLFGNLQLPCAGEARHESPHQRLDILGPLAQRRHAHLHDVQAVEQVAAEPADVDQLGQHAVGRRDHADVHRLGPVRPDRIDDALLQHAQHLGLHRRRKIADLVEEQRSPVGAHELPAAIAAGAGERPADVPEQLALEQLGRNRRARHRHERPARALRARVQTPRDQLLAGPALAADQHRCVPGSHPVDHVQHLGHRGRAVHDLVPRLALLAQAPVLLEQPDPLQGAPDHDTELLAVERLADEVVGAGAHGRDGGRDRGEGGHDDDRRPGRPFLHVPQHRHAVRVRHLEVGHHQPVPRGVEAGNRRAPVRDGVDREAQGVQVVREDLARGFLIVGQQHALPRRIALGHPPPRAAMSPLIPRRLSAPSLCRSAAAHHPQVGHEQIGPAGSSPHR